MYVHVIYSHTLREVDRNTNIVIVIAMFYIIKFNIASAVCHFRYEAFMILQLEGGAPLRTRKM